QRGLAALPPDELDAHGRVQAALDRLSHLDGLTGPVTREVVAATLEAELSNAPGRVGRVGAGVQAGPLAFVVGHTVDLLVVVGACEGVLPAPPPPEALLTDHDRALTNGALPVDADRLAEQRHQLWAAVAGAQRVVMLWPRGDLRATAVRQPSRWLADLAELAELTGSGAASHRSVPSFAAGLATVHFPATVAQHRVRALWHAAASGVELATHPLVSSVPALARAAPLIAARASADFTPYDGDVSSLGLNPLGNAPMSPTRLEGWVSCPHAWFIQHVLGVEPVEQPDEQLQITPKDRGNLVHEALDRFHRQVIAGVLPQPGPHGWSPTHETALLACFADAAEGLEQLGLVGRTAFWHTEQDRQRGELVDWLRVDGQFVAERGATVLASEHRFGFGDVPPATLAMADGTAVQFRGFVDRIDRCADGSLVVTDHKTGSANSYRDITDADPTAGGSRLQLPAYAAAARALVGAAADTPVTAEYGFLGVGGYKRVGSVIGAHNRAVVETALTHIIDGIRSGVFVARPEKAQYRLSFIRCPYCDPDGLGTAELWVQTDRKMADPRVAALLGPGVAEEVPE
ncbi:MAG TPA: hypothetical protein DCR14_04625, partial [Acidimicrobiaceae bacterium]|nr:hypothetical protein [Acidimicrobiaceae bacterium]